jgi:type II secretory pathway pseudopilin PulG
MEQQIENLGQKLEVQDRRVQKKSFLGKIWPLAAALIIVVFLLLSIVLAWNSGKNLAQSKLVVTNVSGLQKALDNFYDDQDRFPTAQEFADRNIMINYANLFPSVDFVSKSCSQSFVYKRTSKNNYILSFCLPKKEDGFKQGWSQVTINK